MSHIPVPTSTIQQYEILDCLQQSRIQDYPVAVRTTRETMAGGFANQIRHPNTWTVYFLIDGQWAQVQSARGLRREWSSLDRMEKWLRGMGFRFFWVRNDIDEAASLPDEPTGGPSMK